MLPASRGSCDSIVRGAELCWGFGLRLLTIVHHVSREFQQIEWDAAAIDDCRQLVRLAIREDLDRHHDWTTVSLVPEETNGRAAVVAREPLVVAGLAAAQLALAEMDKRVLWTPHVSDGAAATAGTTLALIQGEARSLLTAERIILNLIGRLSGVATLTRQFVEAVWGTKARIYDTRKTTPGWRRLEKYAVRCGGGHNHRTGLFDAILIKDNHVAFGRAAGFTPAGAVRHAARFPPRDVPERPARRDARRSRSRYARPACRSPARRARHRAAWTTCRSTSSARRFACVTSWPRNLSWKPRAACGSKRSARSPKRASIGSAPAR